MMGVNFCGFRRGPSPNRSSENEKCGLTASVLMKFLKPRRLWRSGRKREFHPPELQLYKSDCKVFTLEDCITASPDFNPSDYTTEMPMHKQSSRKIHPSLDGNLKQELLPESGDGFSVCRRNGELVCRTKGGKGKKKVSFRSPEVADVFVLDHSPEIYVCVVGQ